MIPLSKYLKQRKTQKTLTKMLPNPRAATDLAEPYQRHQRPVLARQQVNGLWFPVFMFDIFSRPQLDWKLDIKLFFTWDINTLQFFTQTTNGPKIGDSGITTLL